MISLGYVLIYRLRIKNKLKVTILIYRLRIKNKLKVTSE